MKRMGKWGIGIAAACVGLALTVGVGIALGSKREARSGVVSVGVQRVADATRLAVSAPVSTSVRFDADFFDRALGGARVAGVTITRLPDATRGTLKLGYGELSVSQTVSRENLAYLSFVSADAREASFSFVPKTDEGEVGYEVSCVIRFTEGQNTAPVGESADVYTHAGLALDGMLSASDPEGDALYFEVSAYPKNGTVMLDAKTGAYTYMPQEGFDGEDIFCWRVQDENGAFGEERECRVSVMPHTVGYFFADMTGNGAHSAALCVTEKGLLSGEVIGGKHYFHPERTLTRAAFVAMLLDAAEIKCPDAESTGFADDADIPRAMRGAIKYAKEKGWLGEGNAFRPHDAITRAEAAEIAARVFSLGAPSYGEIASDHQSIPASVVDAIYAAFEGGYLPAMSDGSLSYASALTRAEAAVMLARIVRG